MLHTQKVAIYLTKLQRIGKQAVLSYFTLIRHFENSSKVLVALNCMPRTMSSNQPDAETSEEIGELLACNDAQSSSKKISRKQKKRMRRDQKKQMFTAAEHNSGSTAEQGINQMLVEGHFPFVGNQLDPNVHVGQDLMISGNTNMMGNIIPVVPGGYFEYSPPMNGMTPNQIFLSAYTHTFGPAQAVGCVPSPPKQKTKSSHKRGIHNESTPSKNSLPKMNCSEYWSQARVDEGIQAGTVVTGNFRINQRAYTNAYITGPNGQRDILIEGVDRRNRAMHGDFVAVELISDDNPVKKEVHICYRY